MLNEKDWLEVHANYDSFVHYANKITNASGISGEDMVHDVLVKVAKSPKVFTENDNLRAYIFFSIGNHFTTQGMREARKISLASNSYGLDGEGSAKSNDEAIASLLSTQGADKIDLSPRIIEALNSIPLERAQAVILVDFYGYQYDEAADLLATPKGTVMSRLHRGRKQLRELLVDKEHALH